MYDGFAGPYSLGIRNDKGASFVNFCQVKKLNILRIFGLSSLSDTFTHENPPKTKKVTS